MGKYSFTINTDASHRPPENVAAWACWIKSGNYLIKAAKLFDEPVPNSSVAELMAIEQALLLLDNLIHSQEFLRHYSENDKIVVYFNTDSLWAIHSLKGIVKRTKHKAVVKRVQELAARYEIVPRHVKGHTKSKDARSYVNNWCDRQSRALVQARVKELYEQKSTRKV